LASCEGFDAPAVVQNGVDGQANAWFRPHETALEREGSGLAVRVSAAVAKGATVRLECRSADGAIFVAEYPREAPQAGMAVGSDARLRARRVFVFADGN
jgi:hypothetical protein